MANGGLRLCIGAGVILAGMAGANAQEPFAPDPNRILDPIEGIWQTLELSEITIALCPEGFCGTLSKIVVPREGLTEEEYAAAMAMPVESFPDVRNPDPALRSRPMLGLQILTLLPSQKPYVYDGAIYNPETGRAEMNDIGAVQISLQKALVCDTYEQHPSTGAFVLIDEATHHTVAAGMIRAFTA